MVNVGAHMRETAAGRQQRGGRAAPYTKGSIHIWQMASSCPSAIAEQTSFPIEVCWHPG